jgi:protein NrfD
VTPEYAITRHNPLVDPFLSVWGWEIPVYLFLGGLVAGLMIISGYLFLSNRHAERHTVVTVLPGLGLALLSLGMLALFLDLDHKRQVWRLYTTFQVTSPMSWGAWILLLVYPALAVSALVRPPAVLADFSMAVERGSVWMRLRPQVVRLVGASSIGLGVALGIYTGVLLSSLGARPLWNSGLLGILFLVSGVSAAAALSHLLARGESERSALLRFDGLALAVEFALLALLLFSLLAGNGVQMAAAELLLTGAYAAPFWVLVVAIGIVVPFVLQALMTRRRIAHTAIAPLLVLAGGLALRFVFVYAGQVSHWAPGAFGPGVY